MAIQPCVELRSLAKKFGSFIAVSDVNLEIEQGEFFSLLGSSGCGKSTLLRMIAGLETPTSGHILVDGSNVTRLSAHKRPTNMMFQSYALFPHLSVAKNIAFGLRQESLSKDEIAQRLSEVAVKLQLENLMERKPDRLSGGQKQRVALARALVKRPRVLLLDEPLAALDKNLRAETQHELLRLQKELGITFIIVTHDQEEAMTVSSRLAIMCAGSILQIGTPAQIYETPDSRYIAKFLGETNIFAIDGVRRDGSMLILSSREAGGDIRCPYQPHIKDSDPCWLSVRPERISLLKKSGAKKADEADAPSLEAMIEQITYTGVKRQYRLRLQSGHLVDCVQINQGNMHDFAVSEAVFVDWQPQAARLLSE